MKNLDEKIMQAELALKKLQKKKLQEANEKSKHIVKPVINFMNELYDVDNKLSANNKALSDSLKKSLLAFYADKPRILKRLKEYFK